MLARRIVYASPLSTDAGTLIYYGVVAPLRKTSSVLSASTFGQSAWFVLYRDSIDVYDPSLTKSYPAAPTETEVPMSTSATPDFLVTTGEQTCVAYNSSYTKYGTGSLSVTRRSTQASHVGNYVLFSGGLTGLSTNRSEVDAFDSAMTRTTPASLSASRYSHCPASIGGYALFAGGVIGNNTVTNIVDAYDTSLTRTTAASLSTARYSFASTTNGDYALMGGGHNYITGIDVVESYSTGLTHSVLAPLSVGRTSLMAASCAGFSLFAGGMTPSDSIGAGATAGNYALFGGGRIDGLTHTTIVEGYTVI